MEECTLVQVRLPKDFNYKLEIQMVKLKQSGVKTNKADLIVKLAQVGLQSEKI
jgi:hypothetical protein